MTNPPVAFLAYLTQPAPGVCLLNLQTDRDSEFQQFEISIDHQLGMLVKLADMASQHNRRMEETV
jgi:hypothetical protein